MEENKKILSEDQAEKASGGAAKMDVSDDECPKCHSRNIKFIGFLADHELVNFRCNDCGYYWEMIA